MPTTTLPALSDLPAQHSTSTDPAPMPVPCAKTPGMVHPEGACRCFFDRSCHPQLAPVPPPRYTTW